MVSVAEVSKHIKGADFPASKQELINKARTEKAPKEVIEALQSLPERQYRTMPELWKAVGEYAPEEKEVLPYESNEDLPLLVQEHLPEHAQDIYREAFKSAWEQYKDPEKRYTKESREEVSHKVAWAAVEKKYEKHGDKWVEKQD